MFRTLPRLLEADQLPPTTSSNKPKPYNYLSNPYRAQRLWPPDFSTLDHTRQFRFERKYKRRMKMKYLRPRWVKGVKIVQMASVVGICVYASLFLDWSHEGNPERRPFAGFRKWFFGLGGELFGSRDHLRDGNRRNGDDMSPVAKREG